MFQKSINFMNREMLLYFHGNRVHISPHFLKIIKLFSLNPAVIGAFSLSFHVSNWVLRSSVFALRSPLSARIRTFPENPRRNTEGDGWRWRQGDVIFFGSGLGLGAQCHARRSVPRRVRVTEQGRYRRGWAAGKTRRPAWRAAPALFFLTWDLAFFLILWGWNQT
jgi:hypothetical protein